MKKLKKQIILCLAIFLALIFAGAEFFRSFLYMGGAVVGLEESAKTGEYEYLAVNSFYDRIGYLCAKYESEGHPELADTINHGFGLYQFDIGDPDIIKFITYCYEKAPARYFAFARFYEQGNDYLRENESALAEAWRICWEQGKDAFWQDQNKVMFDIYYYPTIAWLRTHFGIDLEARSDALKAAAFSLSVRGGACMDHDTGRLLSKVGCGLYKYFGGATNDMSDLEILNLVYDRALQFHTGDGSRWTFEKRDAIDYLNGSLDIYQRSTNGWSIDWSERRALTESPSLEHLSGQVPFYNGAPYFNQHDYTNVSFAGATVSRRGCGITCFSMLLTAYTGIVYSPEITAPEADSIGADTREWSSYKKLAKHYGITLGAQYKGPAPGWGGDMKALDAALARGEYVICSMIPPYWTKRGHYVLVVGKTADGMYLVNDPASRERSSVQHPQSHITKYCKQYWIFHR